MSIRTLSVGYYYTRRY